MLTEVSDIVVIDLSLKAVNGRNIAVKTICENNEDQKFIYEYEFKIKACRRTILVYQ